MSFIFINHITIIQPDNYRRVYLPILCSRDYKAILQLVFYMIYNKQSLEISPQILVNNKDSRVYIIINEIYFIIYALFINFHKHFIFHLVEAASVCVFVKKI